jgi:acetyl-CoA decarbonylase/synthase complex subunit gamma
MALSGLEIYKYLPKSNCRECGFPTCLAFALQLAAKKVALEKCPHVSQEAKSALASAAQPPIKLVTIGTGENRLEVGNETVLFRHEETFYHPTGIGFLIEDSLPDDEIRDRLEAINELEFERVGQLLRVNLIALRQVGTTLKRYLEVVKTASGLTDLNLVLMSQDPQALKEAAGLTAARRPLIHAADKNNFQSLAAIAKQYNLPLVISDSSLEGLSELSKQVASLGVSELVLEVPDLPLSERIYFLTQIRRLALKRAFRPLGYPTIVLTNQDELLGEAQEASALIAKYASIIIMKNYQRWFVLPLLTERQNIYTDPQKPLQVEAKLNAIGNVTERSPLAVTTNFSLTFYTVLSEIEASKVPTYLLTIDTEGMSVLTAWAAEKFTSEKIAQAIKGNGVEDRISHRRLIIPGYVAVMSGDLEEKSGWQVIVGPREAAGIPSFWKGLELT